MKGLPFFNEKCIYKREGRKGYIFRQNGLQKGKRLDLVAEPPSMKHYPFGQRPVSRKPQKLFGPVKPFLVHLYLKRRNVCA